MKTLNEVLSRAKTVNDDVILTRRLITPEAAEIMLENNSAENRSVRPLVVEKYARELQKGNWEKSNPGMITFWKDGTMVDGQHRLMAIAKSGVSVVMTVAVVPVGVSFFDGQAKRSTANYIEMKYGIKPTNQMISAITMYCFYSLGVSKEKTITPDEIYRAYAKEPELWNAADDMTKNGAPSALARRGCAVFAAHNALKAGIGEDVVRSFFKVVNTGYQNSQRDNQAVAARNDMLTWRGMQNNRTTEKERAGILEEYIRLYANGSVSTRKVKTPTWCYTKLIEKA